MCRIVAYFFSLRDNRSPHFSNYIYSASENEVFYRDRTVVMRKMRRSEKQLEQNESYELLQEGDYGVLGLVDENGEPYTVPLNYCLRHDTIYFHGAREGRKLNAVMHEPRASFTVVIDHSVQSERFTTYYTSIHVHGLARIVENKEERYHALRLLASKYSPGLKEEAEAFLEKAGELTTVFAMDRIEVRGKRNPAPE